MHCEMLFDINCLGLHMNNPSINHLLIIFRCLPHYHTIMLSDVKRVEKSISSRNTVVPTRSKMKKKQQNLACQLSINPTYFSCHAKICEIVKSNPVQEMSAKIFTKGIFNWNLEVFISNSISKVDFGYLKAVVRMTVN